MIQIEIDRRDLAVAGFGFAGEFGFDEGQLLRIESQTEANGVFSAERIKPDFDFICLPAFD
ncbi:MAG TPA: hypothetical protein PKA34_12970 [Blastocatellia bacterium]|nr:hypothetical protein [Blastocatellia bacterium]